MDQEIMELTERIKQLKTERNTLCSISLLPDEILSHIFFVYGAVIENPYRGAWTRLMVVCRKWRALCMVHAALWSFFSPQRTSRKGSEGLDFMQRLKLSAQYPLSVMFDFPGDSLVIAYFTVHDHAHRIQSLSVHASAVSDFEHIFKDVSDLPKLKELKLDTWASEFWSLKRSMEESIAPHLQSLVIHNVKFFSFHLLANLTTLSLERFDGQTSDVSLPTFSDILAVLYRSPRLHTLKLQEYWRASDIPSEASHTCPVILKHLRSIELFADVEDLCVLLQTLQMPPKVLIRIVARQSWDGDHLKPLLVPLRRHLRRPGGYVFRSLTIEKSSSSYISVSADTGNTCPSPLASSLGHEVPFSIITYPPRQRELRAVLSKIIHALPLDPSFVSLDSTWISYPFTPETWRTIGMALPQLKRIEIGMGHQMVAMSKGFISALERGLTKGQSGRRRRRIAKQVALCPDTLFLHFKLWRSTRLLPSLDSRHLWFDTILHTMKQYRGLQTVNKPAGELWDTLQFDSAMGHEEAEEILAYRDRLFEVVKTLILDDQVYDPAVWRAREEKWRRQDERVRLALEAGEVPLLDSDED